MPVLRNGSTGPLVGLLQSVLMRLGYFSGNITYYFGSQTEAAVKKFQTASGLVADGIVGSLTWAALMPYISGNYVYEIKQGDTFYTIAQRLQISLGALLAANPLADPQNLTVGQSIIVPYVRYIVPTDLLYSYDIMMLNIESLLVRYPFLEYGVAGKSVMGKPLPYFRIGRGTKNVFYNASHHANEWITSLLMMKFIENFAYSYATHQSIRGFDVAKIFDSTSIYIMPMVNPDGVDLVTGAADKTTRYYKYAESIKGTQFAFPDGWKANIRGVDLNLNYPAEWLKAKENKEKLGFTSPGPRDYVGPYPFSEPESRAAANLTANISPSLTLSYHTQGELIYWKFLNYNPENSFDIAQEFARLSGYTVSETPYESGFAGYKDWFIQEYDRPGYTIEAGLGTSPLPLSQFDKIYRDNIGILLYGAQTT